MALARKGGPIPFVQDFCGEEILNPFVRDFCGEEVFESVCPGLLSAGSLLNPLPTTAVLRKLPSFRLP